MKIKCAYGLCQKLVDKNKAVQSTLRLLSGRVMVTEDREYCSARCAECDRMAHEP
jgi:hypothetical protein